MESAKFDGGTRETPYGLTWSGPCGACQGRGTWIADHDWMRRCGRTCEECQGSGRELFEAESVDALRAALAAGLTTLEAELRAHGLASVASSPARALAAVRADQRAHARLGLQHCGLDDLEAYLSTLAASEALQEAA